MYETEISEYNSNRVSHMDQICAHLISQGVPQVNRATPGVIWDIRSSGAVFVYCNAPDDEDDWSSTLTTGEWCSRLCIVSGEIYQFGRWSYKLMLPDGFIYEN
jgi:hypothetical protein